MKNKILAMLLIFPLIFTSACSSTNDLNADGAESSADVTNQQEEIDNTANDEKKDAADSEESEEIKEEESNASVEKATKELYMSFLKDEITCVCNCDDIGMMRIGNKYSYSEIIKFINMSIENDGDFDVSSAGYAFLDCGDDGTTEMAVKIVSSSNYDEYSKYLILDCVDGEVRLIASAEGYYRTTVTINEYGLMSVGGSNGASAYGYKHYFINADGEKELLYDSSVETNCSMAVIPSYYIDDEFMPADYPDALYTEEGANPVYVEAVTFEEYDSDFDDAKYREYLASHFFCFYDEHDKYVEPAKEYKDIYDKHGIKYYGPSDLEDLIVAHEEEMGVTEKIRNAKELVFEDLSELGIGEYAVRATNLQELVNMFAGNWLYQNINVNSDVSDIYLEIDESADFKLDVNYKDKYVAPGYVRGHIKFETYEDYAYVPDCYVFYIEDSNIDQISGLTALGDYSLDSCKVKGEKVTMTLNQLNNGDTLFTILCDDFQPVFEKENKKADSHSIYEKFANYSENYYYNEYYVDDKSYKGVKLVEKSVKENGITDELEWFDSLSEVLPGKSYNDGVYKYELKGTEGYGTNTKLSIYDLASNELQYTFDFNDFVKAEGYENSDYVDRSICYALIDKSTLYVNLFHNTYSSSCPLNGYIIAIDLESMTLKWKSEPLVSNSRDFVIVGDSLICGYGFTAEDHYISVLDIDNGKVMDSVKIKKSPEYFVVKDDILYVRTYSYDYEYSLKK